MSEKHFLVNKNVEVLTHDLYWFRGRCLGFDDERVEVLDIKTGFVYVPRREIKRIALWDPERKAR